MDNYRHVVLALTSNEAEEILAAFKARREKLVKMKRLPADYDELPKRLRLKFADKFGWTFTPNGGY